MSKISLIDQSALKGAAFLDEKVDPIIEPDSESRPSKPSSLIALVKSSCELWHDDNGDAFATFEINNHKEHWPIDSRGFREWLCRLAYLEKIGSVGKDVLNDVCANLGGIAKFDGHKYATGRRVMHHGGAYWIDLANDDWQAVKVDSSGWKIVDNPPVRFLRNRNFRPLPMPVCGGNAQDLFKLINIPEEDEMLVLAWILECYRPDTQYPVLELNGEQGSAKSTTQRVIRLFIDNNEVMLRARPKTVEDVYVAANNGHVVSYENMSGISGDMSDAFCMVSTGAGYAARKLYTNGEESTMKAKNPIILNGINRIIVRPDLIDRSISISCPTIKRRIDEEHHRKMVDQQAPSIFGGLLDLFSRSLKILPDVKVDSEKMPRMTGFTLLGEAMSRALGNDSDVFVNMYIELRKEAVSNTIDATQLGRALLAFVNKGHSHIGIVGDLFKRINEFEKVDGIEHGDYWPKTPRKFGYDLRRLAPALRQLGIVCWIAAKKDRNKHGTPCELRAGSDYHPQG